MDVEMQNNIEGVENHKESNVTEQQTVPRRQEIRKPLWVLLWQFIPFIRRVFLYFSIIALIRAGIIKDVPIVLEAILKCAPLMTLTIFIYRQYNSVRAILKNKYGLLIFFGHVFAIVGALILAFVNPELVILVVIGKAFHLISFVLFTVAFGFRPFASRIFVRSVIAAIVSYYFFYISAFVNKDQQNTGLEHKIITGLLVVVVYIMQWRAWARVTFQDLANGRWYEFLGGLGASILVLSELVFLIAFYIGSESEMLLGGDFLTLALVYLGNFFVALSVFDGENIVWPQEAEADKQRRESFKQSFGKASIFIKTVIIRTFDWIFS